MFHRLCRSNPPCLVLRTRALDELPGSFPRSLRWFSGFDGFLRGPSSRQSVNCVLPAVCLLTLPLREGVASVYSAEGTALTTHLSIGEFARITGLSVKALRFYH